MYVFSEELQQEIDGKTREICKQLNLDVEKLKEEFERFHSGTREHEDVVRYFIKRREVKLFQKLIEMNMSMPLRDVLDDRVWNYLHLMYLLYENAHTSSKPEVQAFLLKVLEQKDMELKPPAELEKMLKTVMSDSGIGDILSSLTGGGGEKGLGDMLKSLTEKLGDSELMKNINLDDPSKTMENIMSSTGVKMDAPSDPNLIKNIIDDIAGNIKESGSDITKLMENTKNMGMKYQEQIAKGDLKVEDMMGSLMGVLQDPSKLVDSMKDMDIKNLPDPQKLLSGLLGGIDTDTNNIMSQVLGAFENKQAGEASADKAPLTEDQLKELEEFYSNLSLK